MWRKYYKKLAYRPESYYQLNHLTLKIKDPVAAQKY